MLVYYEVHALYVEAARREKRFKNWPRQWKINLIEKHNPEWRDQGKITSDFKLN